MDKKSVQALIDNRLGSIIDGMNLGLWPSDKIKLHDALSKTETLSSLSNLYELTQEFANATKDETND